MQRFFFVSVLLKPFKTQEYLPSQLAEPVHFFVLQNYVVLMYHSV